MACQTGAELVEQREPGEQGRRDEADGSSLTRATADATPTIARPAIRTEMTPP